MPIPILMPALSPTMEEGKLAKWLVKEGDSVGPGDVIAEIETDKATMEVEAVDEGTIGKLLISEGTEGVPVNKPIAMLLEEGESADALKSGGSAPPAKPDAPRPAASPPPAQSAPAQSSPPAPKPAASPAPQPARPNGQGGRILASPLARRIAAEKGVDLASVTGSGPHGRIVKRDVEMARPGAAPAQAEQLSRGQVMPVPSATAKPVPALSDDAIFALYEKGSFEIVPHDGMRRTIAQRLTQAKSTIPHFYLNIDCKLDALLAARQRLNALSAKEGPKAFKISVNDLIIKAMAMALQKVPAANATWTEQGILRHRSSDIGVAVAIDGGLFTPVIRHAEVKSLSEISNEMKDLAERARKRRLKPEEYQGGTTAISNLGMMGVTSFDAVINPPHATILAVGAGQKRPIVEGDQIRIATMMSCTLSCDHRVVDGALGAELLDAFRGFIEEPVTMLV
ncbi:MAG: pyruvate dehydrogenase complex dihydrolipoamide acetyltransferase [Pseudomonadota bacterium]|nr:pyruvate dehydrogenase complex dihydrolipoamide acetyltransferase [Pseudomonadota bacterium]